MLLIDKKGPEILNTFQYDTIIFHDNVRNKNGAHCRYFFDFPNRKWKQKETAVWDYGTLFLMVKTRQNLELCILTCAALLMWKVKCFNAKSISIVLYDQHYTYVSVF